MTDPNAPSAGPAPLRVLVVARGPGPMIQLLAPLTARGHLATGRYTDDEARAAVMERDFDVLVLDADVEPASALGLEAALRSRRPRAHVVRRTEGEEIEGLVGRVESR